VVTRGKGLVLKTHDFHREGARINRDIRGALGGEDTREANCAGLDSLPGMQEGRKGGSEKFEREDSKIGRKEKQ